MMKYIYGSFENIVNSLCTQSVRPSLGLTGVEAVYGSDIDEEESLRLVANACKVVEYPEPVMSRDRHPTTSFRTARPLASTARKARSGLRSSHAPHLLIDSDCRATPNKLCLWICATENGEEEKEEDQSLERRRRS
ncbi:hypothetical protein NL676_003100 [Syzygium grande]|nr:hypothetical protein NL676_003100 [Syzygium grande]